MVGWERAFMKSLADYLAEIITPAWFIMDVIIPPT